MRSIDFSFLVSYVRNVFFILSSLSSPTIHISTRSMRSTEENNAKKKLCYFGHFVPCDSNLFFETFRCNLFLWQRRRWNANTTIQPTEQTNQTDTFACAFPTLCDSCSVGWPRLKISRTKVAMQLNWKSVYEQASDCQSLIHRLFDHQSIRSTRVFLLNRFRFPFWIANLHRSTQFIELLKKNL